MEGVIGFTTLFAGNYAPQSWGFCQGQLISIRSNTALFSILGTTYGGDGKNTFALPDLQGRAVIGAGQGPGLSLYDLGEDGGSESISIGLNQLPTHVHPVSYTITQAAAAEGTVAVPTDNTYGNDNSGNTPYTSPANVALKPFAGNITMGSSGLGSLPIPIINPLLALNYIICLTGVFPQRN